MTRPRLLVASGSAIVVLAVVGLLLWRWGPFAVNTDVPSCPELAERMPTAAGGTWTENRSDPSRRITKSSTRCGLAFSSADQRFSGTVSVLIIGDTDTELLLQEVRDAPCNDAVLPLNADSGGYIALKTCDETIGDVFRATVIAAKKPRWVYMVVTIPTGQGTEADAADLARDLARAVADQGLTVPASD